MSKIRVFVASPGDVPDEREIVPVVVEELRRTIAPVISIELETVRWETHAWPDVGDDVQDLINSQIGDYDVFVGIMWKRFGTPTKRADSGTGEEFERAYSYFRAFGRPKIMFYFRTQPFYTQDAREMLQFKRVLEFRKKLEKIGVLFWQYEEPIEFERRFREHLTLQLLQQREDSRLRREAMPRIFLSYKREDIKRVEPIYDTLKNEGMVPWMDVRDILPGKNWVDEIEHAIRSSDFFLTFISENTVDPVVRNVTGFGMGAEVAIALDSISERFQTPDATDFQPDPSSYVIPVRLDPVLPQGRIASFQWIDLFSSGGLQQLIRTIKLVWQQAQQKRSDA